MLEWEKTKLKNKDSFIEFKASREKVRYQTTQKKEKEKAIRLLLELTDVMEITVFCISQFWKKGFDLCRLLNLNMVSSHTPYHLTQNKWDTINKQKVTIYLQTCMSLNASFIYTNRLEAGFYLWNRKIKKSLSILLKHKSLLNTHFFQSHM